MELRVYLQSYKDYFWTWEEEGQVLAVPDGGTIAYTELILKILDSMAEQGLPPFGALLLAIIGTNPSPEKSIKRVEDLVIQSIRSDLYNEEGIRQLLKEVLAFLKTLSELPTQYTTGNKRALLLRTVFASCHHIISIADSKNIIAEAKKLYYAFPVKGQMEEAMEIAETIFDPIVYNYGNFYRDFKCVSLLSRKFPDKESIIDAMAGLPDLALMEDDLLPELPKVPDTKPKDFVEQLIDNPKTFEIGSLVKSLWSGLNIPIHHALPSSQPLGGVSDLSNKGDFDKLLLSEFANDDLVFLSRLANQEALFLRREVPPTADQQERVILIDVSLRNWGTPRILAYAILLAISKHPRTDIHCSAFVLGADYRPISYNNVDEVIASMELLAPTPDCANGLSCFLKEQRYAIPPEIFFISAAETNRLQAMQKAITEHQKAIKYWINIGSEGTVEVLRSQHNARKIVQQLRLPLEELWRRKQGSVSGTVKDNLPAKFPILFPRVGGIESIMILPGEGIYLVSKDLRVYRAGSPKSPTELGWELLTDKAPRAAYYGIGKNKAGELILLSKTKRGNILKLKNLKHEHEYELAVPEWVDRFIDGGMTFFTYQDQAYCKRDGSYFLIEPENPMLVTSLGSSPEAKLIQACLAAEGTAEELSRDLRDPAQMMRSLDKVFINQQGHLVINKHALVLESNGIIHFTLTSAAERTTMAEAQPNHARSEFTFPNGSVVMIENKSMFILKGGNSPDRKLFDLVLKNAGPNKLKTVKCLKTHTSLGLMDCNVLVQGTPSRIEGITLELGESLRQELKQLGAEAELNPAGESAYRIFVPSVIKSSLGLATSRYFAGSKYYYSPERSNLQIQEPSIFYKTHILPFISDILTYGH